MSTESNSKSVWPWRKGSSPSTDPAELLKSLQANMESLDKNTALGVTIAERIHDTIEQAVETNIELRDTTVEELNKLSSTVESIRTAIAAMSWAKEVRDYVSGTGKYNLKSLVNGLSQLGKDIEDSIEDGSRLTSQVEEWKRLEEKLRNEHAAVGEIVVRLTAEHISGYYESARQRHSKRRVWLLSLLVLAVSASVYALIGNPDLLWPTPRSTNGALNESLEVLGYAVSRIGVISLILILLFYIRESLRATERKEESYENKALRIRTSVVVEDMNVNEGVKKIIHDEVLSNINGRS